MNTRTHARRDGGTEKLRPATTIERVAMAAGWTVANAIPDRLYTLGGRWLAEYWEQHVLQPDRFTSLEWFVTDLGTFAEATAFPVETARAVVRAFVAELTARGCDLPANALDIAYGWFEAGRGRDPRPLLWEWRDLGDRHHKPMTFRPVDGSADQ